jgi:adenosylcobinamide-GDP ribazoletransferase
MNARTPSAGFGFKAAVAFLTPLPIRVGEAWPGRAMLVWFPVVGLFLGGLLAGFDALAGLVFGPHMTGWLDAIFLIALTGGLHLDGLADSADGLFSHRDRDEKLRIMRDVHTGTWGVLALAAVVGLKAAALGSLAGATGWGWALVLVPAYSRWNMAAIVEALPYARPQGLGSAFYQGSGRLHLFGTGAGLVLLSLVLFPWGWLAVNLGCGLVLWGLVRFYRWNLGAVTGDMIGATSEVTETLLWIVLAGAAQACTNQSIILF